MFNVFKLFSKHSGKQDPTPNHFDVFGVEVPYHWKDNLSEPFFSIAKSIIDGWGSQWVFDPIGVAEFLKDHINNITFKIEENCNEFILCRRVEMPGLNLIEMIALYRVVNYCIEQQRKKEDDLAREELTKLYCPANIDNDSSNKD